MADLSPAAQAVMDAFTRGNPVLSADAVYREVCAAALRAVADEVTAESYDPPRKNNNRYIEGLADGKCLRNGDIRATIHAIATELENHNG